jgi:hypothetical protein
MNYEERILMLEKNFFEHKYLQDKEYLEAIFDDDYFEMGKSGKKYTKQDAIAALSSIEANRNIDIYDYECKQIDTTVYLAHYITKENGTNVFRTSLWRYIDGDMRILFHQASST